MIGPTGVGKTEIARRLARLAGAPSSRSKPRSSPRWVTSGGTSSRWCASWWTWPSTWVRTEREDEVYPEAEARAEERLLDLAATAHPVRSPPATASRPGDGSREAGESRPLFVVSSKGDVTSKPAEADTEAQERRRRSREKLRQQLKEGKLEEREVEIEVQQQGFPMLEMMQPPQGMEARTSTSRSGCRT